MCNYRWGVGCSSETRVNLFPIAKRHFSQMMLGRERSPGHRNEQTPSSGRLPGRLPPKRWRMFKLGRLSTCPGDFMSHLCWSTTLSTFAITIAISRSRAVSVTANEPLKVLGRSGNSSIEEWWLLDARDWPYRNCSAHSNLICLRWADFISLSAWMAFAGSSPLNKEWRRESELLFPHRYKGGTSLPNFFCALHLNARAYKFNLYTTLLLFWVY